MKVDETFRGESREVEYKEIVPSNSRQYTKTAVAYANCSGGRIIFGVENNTWKITGIPQNKVFEKADSISNAIMDSCEPMIDFDIMYQTIDEKTIVIVQVYPGKKRPYYIKSEGIDKGVYIRVPGSTRLADDFIVKELKFQGANRCYDQMIAIGETVTKEQIEDLCDIIYQYALKQCQTREERKAVKPVSQKNLISWGLLEKQENKLVPTNGFLLLTNNPFPSAVIQCAVFKGTNRAVFLDRKEYDGPLYEQIDEAYKFVLRNIRLGAEIAGLYRKDVYEIPIDSVREMIVNALTYMKNMDQWGSGIPRLMENCQKAGLREPELMEIGGNFRINMFRNTELVKRTNENKPQDSIQAGLNSIQGSLDSIQGGLSTIQDSIESSLDVIEDVVIDLTNTDKELLKLIASNVSLSQAEMAKILKWSIGKVKYYINKLKRRKIIERVGSSQKGYWNILIDKKIFEKGDVTG